MLIVQHAEKSVSIAYIFALPLVLGAIPVLFSTREQLKSYTSFLVLPVISVFTFFCLSMLAGLEGLICLVVIVGPFVVLGAIGAFVFRMMKLRLSDKQTPLYTSLLLPLLVLLIESCFPAIDQYHEITTSTIITANRADIWQNVKNVKNIAATEIQPHFVHAIGVPKPLDGRLDREGAGAVRHISWEKGIRFREAIKHWEEGRSFDYDIEVDPGSIPPTTLDEHVMIGGKYFDVVEGGYAIDSIAHQQFRVSLRCKYRVTTNLNAYSKWWADYILDDFNEMILEVIKQRSEKARAGSMNVEERPRLSLAGANTSNDQRAMLK